MQVREAHQGIVQALKVSPDGRRLASCGNDGTITLWDFESGNHVQTLRRDRPYERLDITGVQGLTEAEIRCEPWGPLRMQPWSAQNDPAPARPTRRWLSGSADAGWHRGRANSRRRRTRKPDIKQPGPSVQTGWPGLLIYCRPPCSGMGTGSAFSHPFRRKYCSRVCRGGYMARRAGMSAS